MTWWQLEPAKKYPSIAPETSADGDVRFPLGFALLLAGLVGIAVAIGSLIFGASVFAGWSIAAGLACIAFAWIVMPGHPRKSK